MQAQAPGGPVWDDRQVRALGANEKRGGQRPAASGHRPQSHPEEWGPSVEGCKLSPWEVDTTLAGCCSDSGGIRMSAEEP